MFEIADIMFVLITCLSLVSLGFSNSLKIAATNQVFYKCTVLH